MLTYSIEVFNYAVVYIVFVVYSNVNTNMCKMTLMYLVCRPSCHCKINML